MPILNQPTFNNTYKNILLTNVITINIPAIWYNIITSENLVIHPIKMWLDLPKPATYAHNYKECFSLPINSSINELTNTTAKSWLVFFFWGLFLRPGRCPRVLKCSLMPLVGLYRQPTCWISPPHSFMDVGHKVIYILQHFECNWALF